MNQLQLWEWEEEQSEKEPCEHWLELMHFDGSREVVSTLDTTVNWQDMTVWSARFIKKDAKP